MTKKDVIVREDLLGTNKQIAAEIRQALTARGILGVNLMSSPGAGKTSLLERIAERLARRGRIAVIEGDIETERDAERIRAKGVPAWQITTGGACHLEAKMIAKVLPEIDPAIDFLFIENVGNLVCPAGYELGEHVSLRPALSSRGRRQAEEIPQGLHDLRRPHPDQVRPLPARAFRPRPGREGGPGAQSPA